MKKFLCALISLALFAATGFVGADPEPGAQRDWPAWSGPDGNLTSLGNGTFDRAGFCLEQAWSRPLGSAYSGISVVGDRLVTAFSDGEADYLVALDTASGVEQWRYRISDTDKGHDGSDDGPLASPAIGDDTVYGLGAWGRLFAVSLADGKELWAHDLVEAYGARKPDYGFTSTPAVVGDLVVVETGGDKGRAIAAFDGKSGKLRWSLSDDEIAYQSPQALKFDGETVLVAVTNQHIYGLEPETGKELFKHRHSEKQGKSFGQPVPVGEDSILITDWPGATLYRVARSEGAWAVEEVWNSRALRGTYALPAPYEGYLYGFSGNFLTCVDAATGETVWKSRPPGKGYLVLVDGHLVIQAESGDVVIAEATPEGYREVTRVQALDRGYYSRPSFAAGKVYVRNLTQIAAVGVTAPDPASPGVTERTASSSPADADWDLRGDFGAFVKKLAAADNKAEMIDGFMAENPRLPLIEGNLVHFIYRGDVDDLALAGNLIRDGEEHLMQRVGGTDFYFLTMELPPAAHFTYHFSEFDQPMADPGNPHKMGPEGREQSVLTTAGWQPRAHLNEPEGQRGRIEKHSWKSEILDNEREVQVYLPAGYDDGEMRYPLLVVNHGDQALSMGSMDKSLDNLIGKSVAPLIVAFVPRADWPEFSGTLTGRYSQAQAEELIPMLDGLYRTDARPGARAVMGPGSAAFASVFAAVHHPGTFGKVAAQSFYHGDLKEDLMAAIESGEKHDLEVIFHWSSYDYLEPSSGFDARADAKGVVAALEAKGHQPRIIAVDDGAGWGMWQARTDEILEAFFPLK